MKRFSINLIFALVMIVGTFMYSGLSSAEGRADFSKEMLEENNNVYKVSDREVLIKSNNELMLVDVIQGKTIKVLSVNQKIQDVHVIANPKKIIVLAQTESNQIQKHVFNDKGAAMSTFKYALSVPKDAKVKWVAPNNGVNERLMIQQGNQFSLYQAGEKKPLVLYNAQLKDPNYEYINVSDWDYRNYPYLVVKYTGQRTMAEDYFVRIVNLYTKKVMSINNFDTNFNLTINDQNRLEVWNSWVYSDIFPANASHPISTAKQTYHSLINLESGKEVLAHKSMFKEAVNQISGWNTQVVGGYVFVQDLENNLWSLYLSSGQVITVKQSGVVPGSKFLAYNAVNRTSYFLVAEAGDALPIIKELTIN